MFSKTYKVEEVIIGGVMAIDKGSEVVNIRTRQFGKVEGWSDLITANGIEGFGFKVKIGTNVELWFANEIAEWQGKGEISEGSKKKIGFNPD